MGNGDIKYSKEKPHKHHPSTDTFRIGDLHGNGGVGTAHTKGRVAIAQIEHSRSQPGLPPDKSYAKLKETLRISSGEKDDPKGNEGQNCAPQSHKEKAKPMGYKDIEPAEKSSQQQLATGELFRVFYLKSHSVRFGLFRKVL